MSTSDRRLRVLMVIQQFFPIVGGAERQAQLLGSALVRRGIDVHLLTGRWSDRVPKREVIDGISVTRLSVPLFPGRERLGAGIMLMWRIFWGVLLTGRGYSVVHIHQALKPAVAAVAAASLLRRPTIIKVGCGGDWNDLTLLRRMTLGPLLVRILKRATRFVALNRTISRDLRKEGLGAHQVVDIPNGVVMPDRRRRSTLRQLSRMVFVGRMDVQKGIDVLLPALAALPAGVRWKLVMIGEGPDRREYENLSRSLGLSGRVTFAGQVPNAREIMATSDIFLLPSRAEGMSNALLEAMSLGLACVATDIGGNAELIEHGKTGLLVPAGDDRTLSDAIRSLLRSRGKARAMGVRARQRIEGEYTIESVADRYVEEYIAMTRRNV